MARTVRWGMMGRLMRFRPGQAQLTNEPQPLEASCEP